MSVAVSLNILDSHYKPALGRFLTSDPIGFSGGDSNLYRYVLNNPIHYIDPSGKITAEQFLGGLQVVGGGVQVVLGGGVGVAGGVVAISAGTTIAAGSGGIGLIAGGAIALVIADATSDRPVEL